MNLTIEDKLADPAFDQMLVQLEPGSWKYIEFGSANPLSARLVIYHVLTPGGPQYGVRICCLGQEGSGVYFESDSQGILRLKLYLAQRLTELQLSWRTRVSQLKINHPELDPQTYQFSIKEPEA